MSTDDKTTYSDPDMPGMTFGRPPTRPSRPAAASEVADDHDPDGDVRTDDAPVGGRDELTLEDGSAEVDVRDERTVEDGFADGDGRDERSDVSDPGVVDVRDEPAVEDGFADGDLPDERSDASGTGLVDDAAMDPDTSAVGSAVTSGADTDEVDSPHAGSLAGRPEDESFLSPVQVEDMRRRWGTAQAGFVDDPRQAVEAADDIVAEAVGALQAAIDERRRELAGPWREDAGASTDALLGAFQSYRSVFERVLSS